MAFKMKGSSYKMGGVATKSTMAYMKSPLEAAKPDYIDIDKDGDTTESMKEASMAKMKSPMEMSSPMLQGALDDGGVYDTRKEYKGGSIYNYFDNPTPDNLEQMLDYASFIETTATPGAKQKAENIRKHAADDLKVMDSDKEDAEENQAENRRLRAEGELGPRG